VPESEVGHGAERMFTGGVDYMYRVVKYEGDWVDDRRSGIGAVVFANGDCVRGKLERGHFHGECVLRYASGWERGGLWKRGARERWLDDEEEATRVAKERPGGGTHAITHYMSGGTSTTLG